MAGAWVDDGVKEGEGLRLAGEKGGLSTAPVPADAAVPAPAAPVSARGGVSLFTDRANQLLVAAIACLTAWRPLSRTLFPDVVAPGRSLAGVSPAGRSRPAFWSLPDGAPCDGPLFDGPLFDGPLFDGPLADALSERAPTDGVADDGLSDDARFDGAAVSGAVSVSTAGLPLGPLGLPMMSAGNGTDAWPGAAAPSSAAASASPDRAALSGSGAPSDAGAPNDGSGTAVSAGAGVAVPSWPVALAADLAVPDPGAPGAPNAPGASDAPGDSDRDDPDRARDEDMFPFSVMVSAVSVSGSTSRPGGATITGGSVARPASSTPSSSVPNGAPSNLQQRLSDK